MKIIIIGGHHISALVLAKQLKKKGHAVYWYGTRYPRWPEKTEGSEYEQVIQSGFRFTDINSGKFHKNIIRWWRIPFGFIQAFICLKRDKPDLIFSFGGYLSVPIAVAGKILGIESFTHEQTSTAGLANRVLKYISAKVFITWPQSTRYFPKDKTVLCGLPVRPEFLSKEKDKLFANRNITILIAGGKQGSHVINETAALIMDKLLSRFNVIHQTGDILNGSDFRKQQNYREKLKPKEKEKYILHSFLNDNQMAQAMKNADIFIGRSGAHVVYELALLGKPAIFIPLPFAYAQEQEMNAEILARRGSAVIIPQKDLDNRVLLSEITKMQNKLENLNKIAAKVALTVNRDAAELISTYVESFFQKKNKEQP